MSKKKAEGDAWTDGFGKGALCTVCVIVLVLFLTGNLVWSW